MSHLLHVDSSIRSIEESRSRKLSQRYTDAWRATNPDGTVTYRDLSANPIPHTDATSFSANSPPPEARSPDQVAAKAITDEIVGEVLAADTIVLGMGLYNFGIPSTVKAWFDRLLVTGGTCHEQSGH